MASSRDLLTVVYQPRTTMRRVLNAGRDRWTIPLVILATVCSQFGDTDIRGIQQRLPGLTLPSALSLVVLVLVVNAACWILFLYLFGWLTTLVGRRLEGRADAVDVRAALAWGAVPVIWSMIVRIPLGIYAYRLVPETRDLHTLIMNFISSGGCTFAILMLTFELLMYVWIAYVMSNTLGEAMRFSSWRGLATIAIVVAVPIVIGVAARLAFKS